MSSSTAKFLHGLFAVPHGQSPKRHASVDKKSSPEKAGGVLHLTLALKGSPQERR